MGGGVGVEADIGWWGEGDVRALDGDRSGEVESCNKNPTPTFFMTTNSTQRLKCAIRMEVLPGDPLRESVLWRMAVARI